MHSTPAHGSTPGRYRVRAAVSNESSVPEQVDGPRFQSHNDAEAYARVVTHQQSLPLIVEKLARAGCWLPLLRIG